MTDRVCSINNKKYQFIPWIRVNSKTLEKHQYGGNKYFYHINFKLRLLVVWHSLMMCFFVNEIKWYFYALISTKKKTIKFFLLNKYSIIIFIFLMESFLVKLNSNVWHLDVSWNDWIFGLVFKPYILRTKVLNHKQKL